MSTQTALGSKPTAPAPAPLVKDRASQLWSIITLVVIYATLPYVAAYVFLAAMWHRLTHKPAPTNMKAGEKQKTVLITGGKMTKALCVARHLKAAGCRVVLIETHKYYMVASRFSSCVDRFVTVPVPELEPKAFLAAIKQLAYEEDADLFVPVSSPVSSVYDARVSSVLPSSCRSLSTGEAWTAALDDKVTFNELARMAGLPVPDTRRLTSKAAALSFNEELLALGDKATKYIFKNLQYDSMRRLDLFTLPCAPAKLEAYMADIDEISANAPWAAQAFATGQEYSTCAIAHEGALTLYTANKASISCFNYEHDDSPKLRHWVETFCRHHKITGVVCIDFFMDGPDGTPLAIECNPRFSSNIANFYDSPTVARAFLEPAACAAAGIVEEPLPSAKEACWMGFELYEAALLGKGRSLRERLGAACESLFVKKDAYFEPGDVLPFLALYYVHIPTLLVRNVRRGNKWAKIDLCIGKLTEVNGD